MLTPTPSEFVSLVLNDDAVTSVHVDEIGDDLHICSADSARGSIAVCVLSGPVLQSLYAACTVPITV